MLILTPVGRSKIPGAGEGLFAKRDIEPGDLVSYFGGLRTFHRNYLFNNMTWNERHAALVFTISVGRQSPKHWGIDEDLVIDIPPKYR